MWPCRSMSAKQPLKERWNEAPAEVEALLHRDRYRRLHNLLTSGWVEIRVVPKDHVFIHGKAGVIEAADGVKTCFLGSINETKSAFARNYEILWEDPSPDGVAWVEEEFDALWHDAYPLPDAIIEEVKRVADRVQIRFDEVKAGYSEEKILLPWSVKISRVQLRSGRSGWLWRPTLPVKG